MGRGAQAGGRLIGHCGYLPVEQTGENELLYALGEPYWGQGFARGAAQAAISYAANRYAWKRIVAMAYAENAASNHILASLGFVYEKEIAMYGSKLRMYGYCLARSRQESSTAEK